MRKLILFLIFCFSLSCGMKSSEENKCISIYYEELNAGTFSVIISEGAYGVQAYHILGKYIRNDDGTIALTDGGNLRTRVGFVWHTVKIDQDMRQLPQYLHSNCRFCVPH